MFRTYKNRRYFPVHSSPQLHSCLPGLHHLPSCSGGHTAQSVTFPLTPHYWHHTTATTLMSTHYRYHNNITTLHPPYYYPPTNATTLLGNSMSKVREKRSTSKSGIFYEMWKIIGQIDDFDRFLNNSCNLGVFLAKNQKYPKITVLNKWKFKKRRKKFKIEKLISNIIYNILIVWTLWFL